MRVIARLSVTSETATLLLHEEKSRNSSVNAAGLKIKNEVCSPRIVKQANPSPQERRGAGEEEGGMQKTAGEREEDMLTINLTQ